MLWITAIANRTEVNIGHSEFLHNNGNGSIIILLSFEGVLTTMIDHSTFIHNTGYSVLRVVNPDNVMITLHLNEFINNNIGMAVVYIPYYTLQQRI